MQPAATPEDWATDPFAAELRDGRLYGRGAADDKSGIVTHAAALRALEGEDLACTVKLVVEGEEEYSAEHLPELVQGNAELLRADVALIADGGNYRTGYPTVGTSVRGAHQLDVRVDVLPTAQHSGSFGGPLPDAAMSLARMIASLHDDAGNVAVHGLRSFTWEGTPVEEADFRAESGVFPEVQLIGSGTLADRTLSQPSINVLAFEAPRMHEVANQIVPTASAAIGVRLAPGEDGPAASRRSPTTCARPRPGASASPSLVTPRRPGRATSSTPRPRPTGWPRAPCATRSTTRWPRWDRGRRSRSWRCSPTPSRGSRC